MKRNKTFYFIVPLLVFLMGMGFIRLISQENPMNRAEREEWITQLKKYAEIYAQIKHSYPKPYNEKKLFFSSIKGFLSVLDPHSYFMDPVAMRSLDEDQQGNFYGIGTRITKYEDRLTVVECMEGTPAYRHGIIVGDVIVDIDGNDTRKLSIDECMQKLRGGKDTTVSIKIKREGVSSLLPFTIKRAEIPLNSVSYAVTFLQAPQIGYISLRNFGNTTAKEVEDSVAKLVEKNKIKGLVIDLRGNAGGSFYAAVDLSDLFLEKGKSIVSMQGRNFHQSFNARKNGQYEDLPLTVLINRGSASASEIVASALQDNKRAKIIGSRSWGKGLVQTINRLSMNTSVALTTAKYYTPNNKCLQRDFGQLDDYFFFLKNTDYDTDTTIEGGVMPDIYVKPDVYKGPVFTFISNGIFFKFARYLMDTGIQIGLDFKVDSKIMEMFKSFLDKEKIEYDKADYNEGLEDIRTEIQREVLTIKFSADEGVRVFLETDPVAAAALTELKKII